jgi:hypothetical protein
MIKQEDSIMTGNKLEFNIGFRLVRTIRPVFAAVLLSATIFTTNNFAHNIPLDKAREIARNYARISRKESPRKYLHYATNCVNAFPGHNHIVRCIIHLQNERDKNAGVWTCTETVELYLKAHSNSKYLDYRIYARGTSFSGCGTRGISQMSADEIGS